nr:PREDICTED: replication protein A 70 kDa DNA-binding subunit [Latimeria chalumnae]|eukprot:XP_014350116.1 PREDICTED: replication protein A 70 kDa DNA-binding subunit [Latimeria chalumnae]
MPVRLSEGAIGVSRQPRIFVDSGPKAAEILQGRNPENPIVQINNIRPISTGNGPPRYRLLVNDGLHTLSSFMLATQMNHMIDDQLLTANCIIKIKRYLVNSLKDRR